MHAQHIDQAVAKLKTLPPERVAEVADFIDFLSQRETDRAVVRAAQAISESVLEQIWDNEADAEYDKQ